MIRNLYVAGCWSIDGTAEKAEEVFAEAYLRRSRDQTVYIPVGGDKGLPQEVRAHLEAYPSANAEADRIERRMAAWLDAFPSACFGYAGRVGVGFERLGQWQVFRLVIRSVLSFESSWWFFLFDVLPPPTLSSRSKGYHLKFLTVYGTLPNSINA
jgi:hypothetical protein